MSIAAALERHERQVTSTKKPTTAHAEVNRIKHLKVELGKYSLAFTPTVSKITGGSVDGDRAWIEFERQQGGRAMKGAASHLPELN